MERIGILKITERCATKLSLFFMPSRKHKSESLLSKKIKLELVS